MFANKNPYDLRMLKDSVYTVVHKNSYLMMGLPTTYTHRSEYQYMAGNMYWYRMC